MTNVTQKGEVVAAGTKEEKQKSGPNATNQDHVAERKTTQRTHHPPRKRPKRGLADTENEHNPENNANKNRSPFAPTPGHQAGKAPKLAAGIIVTTPKQAWHRTTNDENENDATRTFGETPMQIAKELLGNTRDQASREMYAETQRALAKKER